MATKRKKPAGPLPYRNMTFAHWKREVQSLFREAGSLPAVCWVWDDRLEEAWRCGLSPQAVFNVNRPRTSPPGP